MEEGKRIIQENFILACWLHTKADASNLLPAVGDWLNFFGCEVGGNGTMAVIHSDGVVAGVRHYFGGKLWAACLAIPFCVWLGITYLLAVCGIGSQLRQRKQLALHMFLLLTIGYFLLVPGAPSHPRFRVPIMPLVALYAGIGWCWCVATIRNRKPQH
jgi:hypothetical protein